MPVTLKHLKAKVKGEDGYVSFDTVSDGSTADRLAEIEAKGLETIASIPSDYTELSNEVEDINKSLYSSEVFNTRDWENGAISASTGANASNSSRIRTKGYLPWGTSKLYSSNADVRFLVYAYNNNTYVGGWWNDGTFNPSDVKAVTSIDFTQIYANPNYANYSFRACIYINNGTARVDTITGIYVDSLSIVKYIDASLNLSLTRVQRLPDGTDFDNVVTHGSYYVENVSSLATMTNYPPNVGQGGRLFVGYAIAKSRPIQLWLSFNGRNEPYLYTRIHNGTSWQKWVSIYNNDDPIKLRVLGYNIGKFNWGQDGGLSENVDTKISNFKEFFGKINPDIMLYAELSTYIDNNEQYDSVATLLTPLYRSKTKFNENAVFSNYPLKKLNNDEGIYLRDNNNTYAGAVSQAVTTINNRSLCLCGGFLRVLGTEQERYQAFVNLLASLTSYEYAIIYLDTNVLSEEERQSIYNAAVTAGYTVANGGYFGLKETLVPTNLFKPIDNIFVKGNIKIKSFIVPTDDYSNLSSDHLPVITDLELY